MHEHPPTCALPPPWSTTRMTLCRRIFMLFYVSPLVQQLLLLLLLLHTLTDNWFHRNTHFGWTNIISITSITTVRAMAYSQPTGRNVSLPTTVLCCFNGHSQHFCWSTLVLPTTKNDVMTWSPSLTCLDFRVVLRLLRVPWATLMRWAV